MSIESRIRQQGKVFDHWQIREVLGSGSRGKSAVFRLVHSSSGTVKSALKVISLIEKCGDYESLSVSRKSEYEQVKQKCKECAEQEVLLMNDLQGRTNIVDYLDHTFVDWVDEAGFGCDMLIRMELLRDLRREIEKEHIFSQEEILRIGREICSALVLCHSKNILHRDIKPENIFINKDGNYKLGDFGISRILSSAPLSKASTGNCTPEYAAPEQMSGRYDTRVDIYSLGLVLYELSNNNLLPFATSSYITEIEVQERLFGKPLPAPRNASKALAAVILKACAFNPDDRYQTAEEFLDELNHIAGVVPRPVTKNETQKAVPVVGRNVTQVATSDVRRKATGRETVLVDSPTHMSNRTTHKNKPKFHKAVVIGIALVFILAIGAIAISGIGVAGDRDAIAEIIDEANTLANTENYEGAIAKLQEGLDQYPDSDELTDKFNEINGFHTDLKIAAIIAEAESLANNEDFEGALAKVKTSITTYPNSIDLQTKADEYTNSLNAQIKERALTEAAALAESSDYVSAITVIKNAQKSLNNDESLAVKAAEYEEAYVLDISAQVDALMATLEYDEAASLINSALHNVPDNAVLKDKLESINRSRPISLSTLPPFNSGSQYINKFQWNTDFPEDPFGNNYSDSENYCITRYDPGWLTGSAFAEYSVNGEYTHITGTLCPYKDITENGAIYFQIFADDQLVYTSPLIQRKTEAIDFSADIKGAKFIKIVIQIENSGGSMIMSDILLWRDSDVSEQHVRDHAVLLSDFSVFNHGCTYIDDITWNVGYPADIVGTDYTTCRNYSINRYDPGWLGGSAYVEYNINGEYSRLSGKLSPYTDIEENGSIYVQIFADDQLVYTSPDITRKTGLIEFSADINFAKYVKVIVQIRNSGGSLIMSDFVLGRNS